MPDQSTNTDASIPIPPQYAGQRLDVVLATLFPDYSRSRLQAWIQSGHVLLNGVIPGKRQKVCGGELVSLQVPQEPVTGSVEPQNIPLDIIHEDAALLVVNKPSNLVMHPAVGNRDGTVQNALLYHYPELTRIPRAGIVHRLDKDTTGVFVVAKTLAAHQSIVNQLQNRTMGREYVAIVQGELVAGGTIEAAIGRHPQDRKKMTVRNDGKPAITHYRISEKLNRHTKLSVRLESGRTHQIRVHMASIKHALVGDSVYGARARVPKGMTESQRHELQSFPRQALHAKTIKLIHPETNQETVWDTDLPTDLGVLIEVLQPTE